MKTVLISIAIWFCGLEVLAQGCLPALIPMPASMEVMDGKKFQVTDATGIFISSALLSEEGVVLQQILRQRTGSTPPVSVAQKLTNKAIHLVLDSSVEGNEAYKLSVSEKTVVLSASTAVGIFYAIMTLDQLLLDYRCDGGGICPVHIEDAPRYGYRSLMLDPARHFIPLADIRFYIDQMAKYKLNVLQLHLTDDQGWRMEIKKYPLLTKVGSQRDSKSGNNGPHNGFYTQEQLKELVEYARKKHIEIVPEVDVPGHTAAAIAAYPQLGCSHTDTLPKVIGKTTGLMLCAGNDFVYQFCEEVLNEVSAVFPYKCIHLGGDEAAIGKNWTKCEKCQALMKKQGYRKERELMGYFFDRVNGMLVKNGRDPFLWCELDQPRKPVNEFLFDYPKNSTLFSWRIGLTTKCIEFAGKAGIKLIASPGEYCYFDYPQLKGDFPEFNNWGMPVLPLKQAYDFDPGYGLPADQQAHIVGVAGLLWGEAISDINRATYMTFPRAFALAEAGWSPMKCRNWESFLQRIYPNLADLMKEGVSVRVPFEVVERD